MTPCQLHTRPNGLPINGLLCFSHIKILIVAREDGIYGILDMARRHVISVIIQSIFYVTEREDGPMLVTHETGSKLVEVADESYG